MPEVNDTCLFFSSKTVFSFSVYFYTQRVKVCALPLERKELICRLATPPTPAPKRERERMWSKEKSLEKIYIFQKFRNLGARTGREARLGTLESD